MGVVIDFPATQRLTGQETRMSANGGATVVILPVIRIERYSDEPANGVEPGSRGSARRKRRRRASRA